MRRKLLILLCASALFASGVQADEALKTEEQKTTGMEAVDTKIDQMTLEEKVGQLFVIEPDSLVNESDVTAAGALTESCFEKTPVGGFIYMENNLVSEEQTKQMLADTQTISRKRIGLPVFTSVDEEGGTVARIGGREGFGLAQLEDMCEVTSLERADEIGETLGSYLSQLGFNIDFAPVADVWTNPENTVVSQRSFGNDPKTVSEMVLTELNAMEQQGVYGVLKHFPGHGSTSGDTHEGYAYTERTLEELEANDWLPFFDGIKQGVDFIMVGHISVPEITEDETPASLSYSMVQRILRNQMGYDGIIITDAMNMGAIAENYTSAEAAVLAIQAGVDLILMPADFYSAYEGVLDAVKNGEISEERIDESVARILKVKNEI